MTRLPAVTLLFAVVAVTVLGPTALQAQQRFGAGPGSGPRGGMAAQEQDSRREVMARVQAEHERRMVEALGITRGQGESLRALLFRYREARMQIMVERGQIRDDLVRHGQVGGSEGEAQRILDRMRALRARELEMQRAEEEALLEILTPSQILQMQILRDRFSEQIRQLERSRTSGRPHNDGDQPSEGVSSR